MAEKKIAHATPELLAINTAPDNCLVGSQIIPFDISCLLSTAINPCTNVNALTTPVIRLNTQLATVSGDAGSGVVSGTCAGKVEILDASTTVFANGQQVPFHDSVCTMNNGNTVGKLCTAKSGGGEAEGDAEGEGSKAGPDGVSGSDGSALESAEVSDGLQKRLDASGKTLDDFKGKDIFALNKNGELALKPVLPVDPATIDKDALLSQDVIDRMQARIDLNDRANAYMELYNVTGSEQIALQMGITTYSGIIGAGALTGNMLAKDAAGELYNISLDQFSLDILQGTHDMASTYVGQSVSEITANRLQDADWGVWNSKGMGHLFPGNVQFADWKEHDDPELAKQIFNSIGANNALKMAAEMKMPFSELEQLGKRPADYDGPNYTHHGGEDDRFITVINNTTGGTEVFWDKEVYVDLDELPVVLPRFDLLTTIDQVDNVPMSSNSSIEKTAQSVRSYLQADNEFIQEYNDDYSYANFAKQDPSLSNLRDEIHDEDAVFMFKKDANSRYKDPDYNRKPSGEDD